MRQWVSTVKETVSLNADGEEDTTWLQFLQRRMFRGCALDAVADLHPISCRNSLL